MLFSLFYYNIFIEIIQIKFHFMAKLLGIITDPNEILRKRSKEINPAEINQPEFLSFLKDMKLTMIKKDGVGLAAPQIGKNIRLFVANTKNGSLALINPKIIKRSILKEWGEEGCLSVPKTFGKVKRHKAVIVEYMDEKNAIKKIEAKGLLARIFQHEIDHLNGVLFIDKAKDIIREEA